MPPSILATRHNPSLDPTHLTDLLSHITPYLTVCIHHILHLRSLYPARAFLLSRAYNFPVYQCRHPAVCAWVNAAVEGVGQEILRLGGGGDRGVRKVGLVVFDAEGEEERGGEDDGGGGEGRYWER
jgi:mitotic spindle assembly checkpoint protein MAD2B